MKDTPKLIVLDSDAASADPELPAFLARPAHSPVYHGFQLVEETRTDGWVLGIISAFEGEEPSTWGDAFVVAPDGTRAGLVWEVGDFEPYEVCSPTPDRWGVWGVAFQHPVQNVSELVSAFREALPKIKAIYSRLHSEL